MNGIIHDLIDPIQTDVDNAKQQLTNAFVTGYALNIIAISLLAYIIYRQHKAGV